jgi:hypothetical protein
MLKKHGKFYARWTGLDGKRHVKACTTRKGAIRYSSKMRAQTQEGKAPRTRRSAKSRASGKPSPRKARQQ